MRNRNMEVGELRQELKQTAGGTADQLKVQSENILYVTKHVLRIKCNTLWVKFPSNILARYLQQEVYFLRHLHSQK